MKKLLIATMAAVSVGLYAKATDAGFISGTSFEVDGEFNGDGQLVIADQVGYWEKDVAASGDDFYTNLLENTSYPSRPAMWAGEANGKALAIDTSAPLIRNVKERVEDGGKLVFPAQNLTTPVFFDSVVQFTATDVAPSMENNTTDKLAVWLYATPEGTEGRLFGEDDAITNLVITAGYYDGDGNRWYTNYLTNVAIQPDTWHRLTIKAINDIGIHNLPTPGFEVYVDGNNNPVSGKCDYDGENPTLVTKFPSLIARDNSGVNYLQGVAFDGKGAVDDIVFTTTDPFYVPPAEAEKVNVSVSINDFGAIEFAQLGSETITSGSSSYEFDKGSTHDLMFMLKDGYELVSSSPVASNVNGIYSITVVPNSNVTVEIVVRKADGGGSGEDPIPTYAVSVVANALEAIVGGLSAEYAEGATVSFTVAAASGYTIQNVAVAGATTTPVLTPNGNTYTFTMPAEAVTITVTTQKIYPSVGGVETPEYSDNAKAAIDAAFPENSYPTDGLTVEVNGETLTGASAVAMLNEAVEMFTLADGAKFFDEEGVMKISFKATNPFMETETAEATDYEAMVGESAATVTSSYTVNKETVDLTPGVPGENEAVTFKLVIQKK